VTLQLHNIANLFTILFGKLPGQLVIQITNYCNATCPQCGMRKTAPIERRKLQGERIRNTLDRCKKNGIDAVSLTGGEPFFNSPEAVDLLHYAGRRGITYLRSGTNGYMFACGGQAAMKEKAEEFVKALAATGIRNFWISLDSADTQTHESMRGLPGVVEGIKNALPVFHAHGIFPAVNLGINRNISGKPVPPVREPEDEERFFESMRTGFTAFFSKALSLGFTMANVCYPMSSAREELAEDKAVYGAVSSAAIINFSPEELRLVFKALLDVIPEFRDKIRIFTPLSVLYALSQKDKTSLFPCLGGCRYFYLDSNGRIYPCGYRGGEELGEDLGDAARQARSTKAFCTKCHWECFRDPSQLFGLARHLIRHPVRALITKPIDPVMLKLWGQDIRYYIKCDFFNGRKPMKKT
jgi:MoaA/NifB/PqqE/SkfB family radical SAM enzyme